MKFIVSRGGLTVGTYAAKFVGAEPITNDYGKAVSLKFEVISGDLAGQTGTRICSLTLSPKSRLFEFVIAFEGGKPEAGEEIDLAGYFGATGMIVVEQTPSGATRVASFLRIS